MDAPQPTTSTPQPDSSTTAPDTQTPKSVVVKLSDVRGYYSIDTLREINRSVNKSVRYTRDIEKFGVDEKWEVATDSGDCEDYALLKLRKCLEVGVDISLLRLATCTVKSGEGHAVLFVTCEGFTYVMDNAQEDIYRLIDKRDYRWGTMQEHGGSKNWIPVPMTMI